MQIKINCEVKLWFLTRDAAFYEIEVDECYRIAWITCKATDKWEPRKFFISWQRQNQQKMTKIGSSRHKDENIVVEREVLRKTTKS